MDVLRPDWMHVLAGEIQCVAGLIQVTDDHTATAAQDFIARVPDPASPIEERLLRGVLLDVSLRWAVAAHRHLHAGRVSSCAFRDEAMVHDVWHVRGPTWPAKRVFAVWASEHFEALHRAHPRSIGAAGEWIVTHSRERVNDQVMARTVGLHVVPLRTRFKRAYGMSVHRYVQRARLADFMRLFSNGSHNVRSALYAAGWRSSKSVYDASLAVTGMPITELRALGRAEWERRLVLPAYRVESTRSCCA